MALLQSSGVPVRAGLVFQAVGLNEHLKVALRDAGVNVVLEIFANAMSLDKIREANLDVFVVNLDPELEDSLEELTDMLDQMRRPVIFNDGAASSGLSGWDQARWARHLAAKITGELDATPPRPLDAKSIPVPVRAAPPTIAAPVVASPRSTASLTVAAAASAIANPNPNTEVVANELPAIGTAVLDDMFAELDFNFDTQSASPPLVRAELDDEESGLEGFDASAFDLPESSARNFDGEELSDLDELFRNSAQPTVDERNEANAESSAKPEKSLQPNPEVARSQARVPTVEAPVVKPKSDLSALDWSLEPLDGESVAPIPTGRAVYVAKELPPNPGVVSKPEAKAPVPAVSSSPTTDDSSELGDFDFFLESDAVDVAPVAAQVVILPPASAAITKRLSAVPAPTGVNFDVASPAMPTAKVGDEMSEFDALFADLNDLSPVSMPATSHAEFQGSFATDSDNAFDSSSLDFDLDFEVGAPSSSNEVEKEDDFADLDALFADSSAAAVTSKSAEKAVTASKAAVPVVQTGPAKVYVLGASIGGPEAVRSFLSKLKPNLPAAFVLAQHMGAEFLELMTSQLAKASSMPVRLAKPGAVFAAGEIVVVPVNQRFLVDQQSLIQFASLPTESPYSPSIDQVMIDMADRFGQRCTGIIFSGMASDAIEGAKYLASRGAKIWVQDPATCVISSMIDGAQAAGVVSFVGAPEQLADHVLDELGVLN